MTEYDQYGQSDFGPLFSKVGTPELPNNEKSAEKRKRVLELLEVGPVTPFDLEQTHGVYRGQATICDLRKRGHIIDTESIDGEDFYVYKRFVATERVTPTLQELYYKSSHWRQLRDKRKSIDKWCQQCHADGTTDRGALHVHHWRYRLFNENVQFDLITFCHQCHQAVHNETAGSSMSFPRFVPLEIAKKIRGIANDE